MAQKKGNNRRLLDYILTSVFILLMLDVYIGARLHKPLAIIFIILFIGHAIRERKCRAGNRKGKIRLMPVLFYLAIVLIIASGVLIIVSRVRDNASSEAMWNILHELSSWGLVILTAMHIYPKVVKKKSVSQKAVNYKNL